jgi:hypothetical protein
MMDRFIIKWICLELVGHVFMILSEHARKFLIFVFANKNSVFWIILKFASLLQISYRTFSHVRLAHIL